MITKTASCEVQYTINQPPIPSSTISTRSYDAVNHTIGESQTYTGDGGCNQPLPIDLSWGNNGHPYVVSGNACGQALAPPCGSLHWDGSQVLYTNGSAQGLILHIGMIAEVPLTPSTTGVVVFDREASGSQIESHWGACYSPLTPLGNRLQLEANTPKGSLLITDFPGCSKDTTQTEIPIDDVVSEPRSDGYAIGDLVVQGVRSYDPTSSQWTTPDAYKGDTNDPMSQRPYMWNNNNPVAYADPSGYCSSGSGSGDSACIEAFIPAASAMGLAGDNRGFDANDRSKTSRVQIMLNFANHTSKITVSASHWANGSPAGRGHNVGTSVSWKGNTATVRIGATCGPCPNSSAFPAKISGSILVTDNNGRFSASGMHGQFPAYAGYGYSHGRTQTLFEDGASGLGPPALMLPDVPISASNSTDGPPK